jgi:hypothetical protein
MNTQEIYDFLNKNIEKGARSSIIVTSRDRLPTNFSLPLYLIVNTDTSSGAGIHWQAVFISKEKKSIFLDSFGRAPQLEIENFIKHHSVSSQISSLWLQKINSSTCGMFSCCSLVHFSRNKTLDEFLSNFSKNRELNHLILLNMMSNDCYNKF